MLEIRHLLPATITEGTITGSILPTFVCRCCGMPMIVVEAFVRGTSIRAPPGRQGVP